MKKHVALLVAVLLMAFVFNYLSSKYTRFAYTQTVLSEKIEETLGFGKSAKKDIITYRERFDESSEEVQVVTHMESSTSTTTVKKLRGDKIYYGSDGGGETNEGGSSTGGGRHMEDITGSGIRVWDKRFEDVILAFNGTDDVSCGEGNVFILAVIGKDYMWERKVKVLEDGIIQNNPSENASIWIKVSEEVGEQLYAQYQLNQNKKSLYSQALSHWLLGRLKLYPITAVKDMAACILSTP